MSSATPLLSVAGTGSSIMLGFQPIGTALSSRSSAATVLGIESPDRPVPAARTPVGHLSVPSLGDPGRVAIWRADQPVEHIQRPPIVASRSRDLLFGTATGDSDEDLRTATDRIYKAILDFVRVSGTPYLVRAWNYFPRINDVETIERYQQFCIGRFEAFESSGLDMFRDLPAGSAVGSRGGPLTVFFVASSRKPRYVENRRQVSAYRYPHRYGPRSPSFARGALLADERSLFISGTASIVGHETVHIGDLGKQVDETLRNLDIVIEGAFGSGYSLDSPDLDPRLKVYIRHADDHAAVAARLETIVPAESILYLQADICRSDLLVEIEGFVRKQ